MNHELVRVTFEPGTRLGEAWRSRGIELVQPRDPPWHAWRDDGPLVMPAAARAGWFWSTGITSGVNSRPAGAEIPLAFTIIYLMRTGDLSGTTPIWTHGREPETPTARHLEHGCTNL